MKSKNKQDLDFLSRLGSRVNNLEKGLTKAYFIIQGFANLFDLLIKKGVISDVEAKGCFKNENTENSKGESAESQDNVTTVEDDDGHIDSEQRLSGPALHRDDT